MKIGYARKSTSDQKLDLQVDALKKSDCALIFSDSISGAQDDREGLRNALNALKQGDILVVWRLDRLGRSLQHLVATVNELGNRGIGFHSLTESLETTTHGGRLIFHIFAALAEFEREVIRSRTHAGLESARARGRIGGRPEKMDERTIAIARRLLADNTVQIADVCNAVGGVSRSTLYRHLRKVQPSTQ